MSENVPTSNINPYDTVGIVLNFARVFALDATQNMDGNLLASSQPYMPTLLNSAWRRLQDDLIDAGVETLTEEIIISSLPPVFSSDPSASVYLTWNGYCNGATTVPSPNLPNDLVIPSDLWERQTGTLGVFNLVRPSDGGLPNGSPSALSVGSWEWRDDKLFMNGSLGPVDLKLRYVRYYPDLVIGNTSIDSRQQVPIMRAGRALGYLVASDFAAARGAAGAQALEANALREIQRITNRTARRKAVVQYRRAAFGR